MSHLVFYRGAKASEVAARLDKSPASWEVLREGSLVLGWSGPLASVKTDSDTGWASVGLMPDTPPVDCNPTERRRGPSDARQPHTKTGTAKPGQEQALAPGQEPDGHFAIIRWNSTSVRGWTDKFGIRSLYARVLDHGFLIGTDLPCLAAISGLSDLDPMAFGSHWLLQNQLTSTSLISGLTRICGGRARFTQGILATEDFAQHLRPGPSLGGVEPIVSALRAHLGGASSLGVSGGLDSRLLLALAPDDQAIHTFGDEADAQVALRIANALERPIRRIEHPLASADVLARNLKHHASLTNAIAPASFSGRLDDFKTAMESGTTLVDGAFGEFGRRMFMGRLVRIARIKNLSPESALGLLRFRRGDYFQPDLERTFRRGALEALRQNWPNQVDGAWADSMGLRYRLPNFFGYEQSNLDGIGRAMMPFSQPKVVDALRATDLKLRKNGRLFRKIIRRVRPELSGIPLVKGTTRYPFRLGGAPAMAWVKLSQAVHSPGLAPGTSPRDLFLARLKPYILDRVHDRGICELFDQSRLQADAGEYFDGNLSLGNSLDWWLSLDAWLSTLRPAA